MRIRDKGTVMEKVVSAPLAERMRPASFDEFIGQEHIVGQGKVLRNLAQYGSIGSIIFWGPPGTGKTTMADLLAKMTGHRFVMMSAVNSGVKDLREAVLIAADELTENKRRTILFLDEIHRFNKGQQDAVLPYVERGTVSLLGATTENPAFEINRALLSRCRVLKLNPLTDEDIKKILKRAMQDNVSGFGGKGVTFEKKAAALIVQKAGGDGRFALNALEAVVMCVLGRDMEERRVTLEVTEDVLQTRLPLYDKSGNEHFDHASAFQKSMRGSDPDAALYWLGKMIVAGESPEFISRRIIVTASEDVGNADPVALMLAVSSSEAAVRIGWPEARIPLAQAVTYIASAPKSNSVLTGIDSVIKDISENGNSYGVPEHLKNSPAFGSWKGSQSKYKYPHSNPGNFVEQQYLPEELKNRRYYKPGTEGREAKIKERLGKLWPERK